MNDFVNGFWGLYVAVIVIVSIIGVTWLLLSQNRIKTQKRADGKVADTGHVWDEDLRELNNPLPRWWFWLFIITILFALTYLALYPGLGSYNGSLNYTNAKEHDADRAKMEETIKPVYAKYMGMDPKQIASDPAGREIGQRLFLNYCAQCHGSDGGGSRSFPNLMDQDWLGGDGSPDYIRNTILKGRMGVMPPFAGQLDSTKVTEVANYVRSLSGLPADPVKVAMGQDVFKANCAACHGATGAGNPAVGAPNLTDKTWLYGSSEATITETILKGRSNQMPAHEVILTPEKVQMLAAYVWGLSNVQQKAKQ